MQQKLRAATRNCLLYKKAVNTKIDPCVYFFLKDLVHRWKSETGETNPSEKTSFLDVISSTEVNPGWRAHSFLKPDLHISFWGSIKCLLHFFIAGKISRERWETQILILSFSFNTFSFLRQPLRLSYALKQRRKAQERVNEQEMVEGETELMSSRAALVSCLLTPLLHSKRTLCAPAFWLLKTLLFDPFAGISTLPS